MLVQLGLLAALGAACGGCSAPVVNTSLALDNPANPDAASVPFVRPVNLLASRTTPTTTVPSTAMQMGGGSMAGMDHAGMAMAQASNSRPTATGTVNAVDTAKHSLNVSHEPIKALGWPSMTMEFPVARSIDLSAIKPGEKIGFTLGLPDAQGNRRIEQIQPQ
jgi:Cu(I)/Ag(I) efflux system protein CusF